MYVKIRKITATAGDADLIITISKMSTISTLQEQINLKWDCEPANQRLFYKGKQLSGEYRIMDYDIQLNDVIQLMIQNDKQDEQKKEEKDQEVPSSSKNSDSDELIDTASLYFKVGDRVDILDDNYGAWFEYIITAVKAKRKDVHGNGKVAEKDIIFMARWERNEHHEPCEAHFDEIRPRSRYTYNLSELSVGQKVLVNYNIENPHERGYWYDMIIDKIKRPKSTKTIIGTLMVGKGKVPLKSCELKYIKEIMKIEEPKLLENKSEGPITPLRKSQYFCKKCRDDKNKKCKLCGCGKCGGKENPATIILCDECDTGYHLTCLDPPLTELPAGDDWYCADCKNDESEVVKVGDKLKVSNKKAKMASYKEPSNRDWGRGMACVGRTKECTIVPKDHYGPVPGVDVGTSWKFRLQVSEAGIHRPHVAGIHGRETDGAYSLVLSGGYEDDVDNGNEFWYTGSGGRDLSGNKRVSEQSCDQTLTRMNKALALNCNAKFNNVAGAEATDWKGGKPVRVVRNYKLAKHSKYAPEDGNRYDGIYKVVKYFPEKGKAGFTVWRYLLRRDDSNPAPWEEGGSQLEMIYPPGYLEAKQDDKTEEGSSGENKRKRKKVSKDQNGNETPKKKKKEDTYKLSKKISTLIQKDTTNEKLWAECNEAISLGKQEYLTKVQDTFRCICCQEVVFKPVTSECNHNICLACLQRSFASEIYTCPYCRFELGPEYKMVVNENLAMVLLELFPGYTAGR